MEKFEVFRWNFPSSINLFFLKSGACLLAMVIFAVPTTTTKTTTTKTGTTKTATANTYCYDKDTDYYGHDITNIVNVNPQTNEV